MTLLYMLATSSSPLATIPPDDIVSSFKSAVPNEFLSALLRSLLQSYKDGSELCYSRYGWEQAKDASGHIRRAEIEKELIGVAERYKQVASAKVLPFNHYTGYYVELTCGHAKLTQSCVTDRNEKPRTAEFRNTLAGLSQMRLFGSDEAQNEPAEYLYGILLHGVCAQKNSESVNKRDRCDFACIRFPDSDFEQYIGGTIDLFKMFPDIVSEFYGQPEDMVVDFGLRVNEIRKVEEA